MSITLTQRTDLITALVGLFDAAPSQELLSGFIGSMDAGETVDSMVGNWTASAEFQSVYPVWLTNAEFATNFAKKLLADNVSAANMTLATDFITSSLDGGASRGAVALEAIRFLQAQDPADADWGVAKQQLSNKVEAATYFATTKNIAGSSFSDLQKVVSGVTESADTLSIQKALIDAGLDSVVQYLTTGEDSLTGTAQNDTYYAEIFDNQNKLQSGDSIDAGSGTDSLYAEIGNSAKFAVSAKTTGLEKIYFQVQEALAANGGNETGSATVDAGHMVGATEFWSNNSRADLVIEDVQTASLDTTIGMRNTDQGDVDMTVYFDNITKPGATTAGSQLFLELLDLKAAAATGDKLTNNPYTGVSITVGGVQYDIVGDTAIKSTYDAVVEALNASLQAQGLTTITAAKGSSFSAINSVDGQSYTGTQIVLTNSGPEVLAAVGWVAGGAVPANTNVHTAISTTAPTTDAPLTQTNVIFDNVGQSSQGGDFLAGNMSTGTSGSAGIQQFNVTVQGSSWLKTVATTNNDLEKVVITNDSSSSVAGDLRIGDKAGNAGLVDVKTVDASAITGALNLHATLGMGAETLVAKYENQFDTAANAAADNVKFAYTTGAGNDTVKLTISEEAVSYEDLELNITTGAGNDLVELTVSNNGATLNNNWLADQAMLNNITISTGEGNDTIKAIGDGEVIIDAGAGADVIYTDNSGTEKASWVLNSTNVDLNDILSETAETAIKAVNAYVTVSYKGLSVEAEIADSYGVTKEVDITDLSVNQAIKTAINSNDTLKHLLEAVDGPARSLVINSLTDGVHALGDLTITFSNKALTSSQTGLTLFNSANFADGDYDQALNGAFNVQFGQKAAVDVDGTNSTQYADNTITGGTGNDVIVLSTMEGVETQTFTITADDVDSGDETITIGNLVWNDFAVDVTNANAVAADIANDFNGQDVDNDGINDAVTANGAVVTVVYGGTGDAANPTGATLAVGGTTNGLAVALTSATSTETSNETIKFSGYNLGTDTIVNFDVTGGDADVLDFSAYIGTGIGVVVAAAGSLADNSVNYLAFDDTVANVKAANVTFASLSAANVLAALNGTAVATDLDTLVFGINADTGAAAVTPVDDEYLLVLENANNAGEYKVFHLSSVDGTATAFSEAQLVGTFDFGASSTALDVGVDVIA
jgi:hypothetical protein